ncbi:mechanosensitive ion channel family protein [Mesobacillus foraminis]|uniref:mechanosensitive ion channel family protein n=1 Tax=Mesobacillus foraminis TaxID=279826 RepID=UPI0035CFE9AF
MSWEVFFSYEFLKMLGISIGILLIFLVFRRIFSKYIYSLLIKLSKKAPEFISHIFLAFEKPIQWLFIIIGVYVAADYFPYFNQHNPLFLDIIRSTVIFLISWGLYNLSSSSSLLFSKVNEKYNIEIDQILIPFLSKALRFVIVAISLSVIAQEFDYDVNGFVAGLGLGGLAFALAAKDALGNLFGGIIIITEKPFTIGDWIMTPSVEGTVEDISFRSTRVRTFSQAVVTVPNATLANESITNWSKMGKRQVSFNLRVTYETPKDRFENVVKQIRYLLNNHHEIHPETILVNFDQYKEDGFEIFIYFFTNTTNWAEYLRIKEEINFEIMDILSNEGVSLAMPSRKVYIETESESALSKSVVREGN